MSNVNCPYDNKYCRAKDQRFSAWVNVVTSYTMPQPINPDTFSGCPNNSTCDRHPDFLSNIRNKGYERH